MNIRIFRVDMQPVVAALDRIAGILERLAGPVTEHVPPYRSTLKDLYYVGPEESYRLKLEREKFALENQTVPDSEAFHVAIKEYELAVLRDYGPEALDQLPWRKVPRGEEAKNPAPQG